jgi:hypothetical protein
VQDNISKFVDRGYPGRLLAQQQHTRYSRSIDAVTEAEVFEEYPADAKPLDVLLSATEDELELLGIDNVELYENYLAVEQEKETQLAEFWQEVDELTEKITNMTEDELQEAFNTDSDSMRSVSTSYSNTFTLTDWVNKTTWYRVPTYCGSNVIAFIMLGLGTKSGYENVPTTDNNIQLKTYYENIESTMGKGPKLFHWFGGDSLNGWLIDFSDGRYQLDTHWGIPSIVSHDWIPINSSIHSNQLPVIFLRLPKVEDIASGFHYRTIIGTRKADTRLKFKVGWWTVTIPVWSEGQYYMHDNGADGEENRTWWEGWSLYHFQAASVLKK